MAVSMERLEEDPFPYTLAVQELVLAMLWQLFAVFLVFLL
jgi:hypothetical protein